GCVAAAATGNWPEASELANGTIDGLSPCRRHWRDCQWWPSYDGGGPMRGRPMEGSVTELANDKATQSPAAGSSAVKSPAAVGSPLLASRHAATARLRHAYAAIPPGTTVRLAKSTSNLFRFRESGGPGLVTLDVSAFSSVLCVDPETRTAVVGGMTTYEDLADATLRHGLMPLVVPQLKTITLGGAVSGLGIESSSLRNGLPHES